MIEQLIRPQFQKFYVDPIADRLKNLLSPNAATVLAGILGLAAFMMLLLHQKTLAVLFLLCSGYMDILDGSLARATDNTSSFGTVLDIMMDRMVEAGTIIGIWSLNPNLNSFSCIIMLASILLCVTSFLVVGIFSQNNSTKSFYYSPGLIERPEAFVFFILMILFQNAFVWLAVVFSSLVILTTCVRLYQFYQQEVLT